MYVVSFVFSPVLSSLKEFSPGRIVHACSTGLQGCNKGMQQQRAHLPDALYKQEAMLLLDDESAPCKAVD